MGARRLKHHGTYLVVKGDSGDIGTSGSSMALLPCIAYRLAWAEACVTTSVLLGVQSVASHIHMIEACLCRLVQLAV